MSEPDFTADITTRLDALFAPWNRTDAPGLLVGVRRAGHGTYRRAFGMASLETGVANGLATRMRIGSTTKHMLATLALMFEEEGLIALDQAIGHYLPDLTGANAAPTIRQLLQHRGGTRCHIDLGGFGHGMLAAPEGSGYAMLIGQTGRNFAPGTATCYNNGGYHLVSLALARLADMPLGELFARRLFAPLGMAATTLEPSDYVMIPGAASTHLPGRNGGWRRGLFPSLEVLGEGGVVSTIDDMLAWAAHLRDGLWPRLLDLPVEADGSRGYYGLGLMARDYRGIATVRHAGTVIGGSSEMICAPQHGLDIVIMTNGAPGASPPMLADKVVDIVLEALAEPVPAPPAPGAFDDWLGDYGSDETGMVYGLENQGGQLHLRVAKYAASWALATEADGWLATGLTGLGTIAVKPDGDRMALRFAGGERRLRRLASAPVDPAIVGRYESVESGLTATIEAGDDGFLLQIRDRWGVSDFEVTPLGGPWLHIRFAPEPALSGATLWYPGGWSGNFVLNSARTRDLPFERIGDR